MTKGQFFVVWLLIIPAVAAVCYVRSLALSGHWGTPYTVFMVVVLFGAFAFSAMLIMVIVVTLTKGIRAMVSHAPDAEGLPLMRKPEFADYLAGLMKDPTCYGIPSGMMVLVAIAVTAFATLSEYRLFSPGTTGPHLLLAIPGLVAGGLTFLILASIVHALMPAQIPSKRNEDIQGCLVLVFYLSVFAVGASIVGFVLFHFR